MNQKQQLLDLFYQHGYKLTLGQLLAHPSGVGYKAATRFSDLRNRYRDGQRSLDSLSRKHNMA